MTGGRIKDGGETRGTPSPLPNKGGRRTRVSIPRRDRLASTRDLARGLARTPAEPPGRLARECLRDT